MTNDQIFLRSASVDEAVAVSRLAVRSKAHWGYSDEFMAACKGELSWSAETLANPKFSFVVAERKRQVVGFYATKRIASDVFELEALFVEPEAIGSGVGRALMLHAIETLNASGASRLSIQGDPNAERFYLAAGGRRVGTRPSGSIPGRVLPLFEIALNQHADKTS